jgi:malonyl-CoA O-methyltransferase
MIDKKKIRRSFNSHAAAYDASAHLQRRVAEELAERIERLGIAPAAILDIGTGTGYIPLSMSRLFPAASLHACDLARSMLLVARDKIAGRHGRTHGFVNADAEFLPYRSGTFDLVVSSLAYQWLENWRTAFREAARVLRSGGVFCFTTLGSGTLSELKDSYRRSYQARGNGGSPALHQFARQEDLRDMLTNGGFGEVSVQGRLEREYHADVRQLLIGLKSIGAQNGSQNRQSGLGRPQVFRGMIDIYERSYRDPRGIPATYELLFGFGRKAVCTSI